MEGEYKRSKFHHLKAIEEYKKENCYTQIKASQIGSANNLAINMNNIIAYTLNNSVSLLDLNSNVGRVDSKSIFKIQAHSRPVFDVQFSPFNSNILGTSSLDGTASIWNLKNMKMGESIEQKDNHFHFNGHSKRVGQILFHPTAENVFATSSSDKTIKFWDLAKGKEMISLNFEKEPSWKAFDSIGNTLAVATKKKNIQLIDPRSSENQSFGEIKSIFSSSRSIRVSHLSDKNLIAVTGFDGSDRVLKIYDLKNYENPLCTKEIGQGGGSPIHFYDSDLGLLYLPIKGEGSMFYYDLFERNRIYPINKHTSLNSFNGVAYAPKTKLDVNHHEIARMYKLSKDKIIPIHIIQPRKTIGFEKDLFPDTNGSKPTLSSDEYYAGMDLIKLDKISLDPNTSNKANEKLNEVEEIDQKLVKLEKQEKLIQEKIAKLKKQREELKLAL